MAISEIIVKIKPRPRASRRATSGKLYSSKKFCVPRQPNSFSKYLTRPQIMSHSLHELTVISVVVQ